MVYTEVIQLKDEVSGPAKKAANALDSVNKLLAGGTEGTAVLVSGMAAAGVAIAAVGVAAVALGAALIYSAAKFAIFSSEAKQASLSTWDALGGGLIVGAEVDDMLDDLKGSLGVSKDALGEFATSFLKMGINSKEALETLTTAAISAEAVTKGAGQGFVDLFQRVDAAAQTSGSKIAMPFAKLQKALIGAGLNIGDMAKQMGMSEAAFSDQMSNGGIDAKKFGDAMQTAITQKGVKALDRLANSSANIKKMFEENIGDMFEDLSDIVGPFIGEVKSFFGVFQKDAPSAKAMTAGIRGVLTEVFGVLTKVVPIAKHFFLDMVILGLRAYIAAKPIAKSIQDIVDKFQASSAATTALTMLGDGLLVVAGAVAIVIGAVVGMGAVITIATVALLGIAAAVVGVVAGALGALAEWVLGAQLAANNFVAGLVTGIMNGAGQVIGAVKGLAGSATGAFKSALGIASPSRVMLEMGQQTGEGFAVGMGDTASDVHGAASGVADAAVKGASGGDAAGAASSSKGGANIVVSVQIDGAGKSAEAITTEMVSNIFQRLALQAGV